MNRPAETSSAIDSAICAVASDGAEPRRGRARPTAARPAPSASRRDRAACCAAPGTARTAGRCAIDSAAAKSTHRQLQLELQRARCRPAAAATRSATSVHRATSRPATPPSTASRHDSVSSCASELPPAGAERQPHRHLGRAAGAAREQQVGDVGAGDQQHDAGDDEQQDERRPRLACASSSGPRRPASSDDRLRLEPRHRLLAHALLQRRLDVVDDRPVDAVDRRARLLDRHARLQPREQVDPVAAPVLEAA